MRALVIGGSGFIGINLVEALVASGAEVRVTRRRSTPTMFLRRFGVTLCPASLQDGPGLREAMTGCDVVFLAGAPYPRYSLDRDKEMATGVESVRTACAAALEVGVPRLIYTSSTATLGPPPAGRIADERDRLAAAPESVYRAAKWAMEQEVDRWSDRGLEVVTILPGGCLGPGDMRVGTGAFLVGVVRGEMPWFVEGTACMVDVGDVAHAHVAAARTARNGDRYCVAGHVVSVGELLARVQARYGGRVPAMELSAEEARARADADERAAAASGARVPIPRELVDVVLAGQPVSSLRAEQELGLQTTPLDRALDRAHAWFARYGYLRPARSRVPAAKEEVG